MTELFDDKLLDEFAHQFYGYGNYDGEFWFIGMEEGGGSSFNEINRRLNVWAKRGKHELEDSAKYHADIGVKEWHGFYPKLQPTWNKLIRIYLSSQGQEPTTDQVREYQRTSFGMQHGKTCLIELLPLPSPSKSHWLYSDHSRLPYLSTRSDYEKYIRRTRITHLRQRITEKKPKAVIFYSLGYVEYWREIVEVDFSNESDGVFLAHHAGSVFVIT